MSRGLQETSVVLVLKLFLPAACGMVLGWVLLLLGIVRSRLSLSYIDLLLGDPSYLGTPHTWEPLKI